MSATPRPQPPLKTSHLTRDQRRACQLLRSIRWRYAKIPEHTGFTLWQSGYACCLSFASPATPKKRSGRPPVLTQAQMEDLIAYVCMSARNRRLSYEQLAAELEFGVGKSTIRAALIREGFQGRLAMRKPPSSERNRVIIL